MQHLDRRLEHLHKFEHALIGAVESPRIAVGVGIVLAKFQLADVDLADEGGDVLIVLVAGLGLGDRDLLEAAKAGTYDAEARMSPPKACRRLCPRRHSPVR